ncbi:hypothetical protein J22TS3_13850 [Paenibacillus sp. J22TS3]|nr:hypothetical protein J22TS3_13850 [Paenibacillus sp. J22TS3]
MNWGKIPDYTFGADDEIYELSDWRDPLYRPIRNILPNEPFY